MRRRSIIYEKIKQSVAIIEKASYIVAFTGAGISVESGIPVFRGENGLWNKYDPIFLDINFFEKNPLKSWNLNKEVFYKYFGQARPNQAHQVLAKMEKEGLLCSVITQNIDNLHQEAGSQNVIEFHGSSQQLLCWSCHQKYKFKEELLSNLPPKCCSCGGVLKPDYVFFGEAIPEKARNQSFLEAEKADVFLIIGTTGEVQPASFLPVVAKENQATIIEINPRKSNYTRNITDLFLQGPAAKVMTEIENLLFA